MALALFDDNRQQNRNDNRNDSQIISDLMRLSKVNEVTSDQARFFESAVKSLIRRLRRSQERGIVENLCRAIKEKTYKNIL